MRGSSSIIDTAFGAVIVLGAFSAPVGFTAHAADATDRTAMPDFCSNREVTCVLPDGPPPRRARGAAGLGDSTVVITPPVGSTSTGAGSVGATPSVPSVPALPGQVPSVTGGVPTLSGQVPALPAQVPTLSGSVPALPGQVPSATSGTASTGTTSSSTSAVGGAVSGGVSNVRPSAAGAHGSAGRR